MAVLDEMKNLENQKKEFMAQLGEVYYKNCKADGTDVPGEAAGIIAKTDEAFDRAGNSPGRRTGAPG